MWSSFFQHLCIVFSLFFPAKIFLKSVPDLLNEPVARGHQGGDDYEGDDAVDGQLENLHYPVVHRGKLEVL
jgi:hypothetical protein